MDKCTLHKLNHQFALLILHFDDAKEDLVQVIEYITFLSKSRGGKETVELVDHLLPIGTKLFTNISSMSQIVVYSTLWKQLVAGP